MTVPMAHNKDATSPNGCSQSTDTKESKPHGNCKPKICNRYTNKKEKCNSNTTLKIVIKPQENKRRSTKTNPNQLRKMAVGTSIIIITLNVKFKLNKCSKQKAQMG